MLKKRSYYLCIEGKAKGYVEMIDNPDGETHIKQYRNGVAEMSILHPTRDDAFEEVKAMWKSCYPDFNI